MKIARLGALWCAAAACLIAAEIPTPESYLGWPPGADYKLADYGQIAGYFQQLARTSDRIRLEEFGKSSEGRPMYAAFISSPENLKRLDQYREANRRLALGLATPEEARKLAAESKAIVWIDSGLHATEVAPVQHAPDLAYRLITAEDAETRRIRDNVILIQIPVINPDGLQMTAEWYRRNVGTPYELAPLPGLYQKYAGHDNNRDYFMLNLPETRHVSRLLFRTWYPQIVYNQHQIAPFPARIFIPPYGEPLNPNIPPAVMEGINIIGSAMKERLSRENKDGAISYVGFDAWWNGGLRSAPAFHNMHGILTETALHLYATPRVYKESELPERFSNGIPTKQPTVFYQRPWLGGRWSIRDAMDYMLTADWAILDLAASRRAEFLTKAWEMARANIEAGTRKKPFAYVVGAEQWDSSAAVEMLDRLRGSGIEVRRAARGFTAGGKQYREGSFVMFTAQPFRGYLVDLMEAQRYPELRTGQTGPTKRPYDIAGWTLPLQMGVAVDRIDEKFDAPQNLDAWNEAPEVTAAKLDGRRNSAYLQLSQRLARGSRVRWDNAGKWLEPADPAFANAAYEMKKPSLGLYVSWTANMDAGWTQWLLDKYEVPYTVIRNEDLRQPDLRSRFDSLLLPSQTMQSILHGTREGVGAGRSRPGATGGGTPVQQRPEYTGGIGAQGVANLEQFVRAGGTLIALDAATELPVTFFPIGVRATLRYGSGEFTEETSTPTEGYYCPGSILRISVDPAHPIGFNMPKDAFAFSSGGQAFENTLLADFNKGDREVKSVARYASKDLLASGWISGERAVLGRSILMDARLGQGRVVLFGFRPQHRGQTFGTFKLLLNSIYLASAERIAAR